jgi:hypothetical protein
MVARDRLLQAIEQVESGGRRDAVSPKGARGRMQVMPATARQPGYRVKPARDESEEEYTRVGRDYAMALLNHYGGDLEATLVAYNYGPTNANKWIASGRNKNDLPPETRNYITKVSKQLGGKKMARRPLEFIKQKQLSELTKKAMKNPDSADARKVVRELVARGLPVPKKLQASVGKARAEAGVGSPPRKVPGPKGKRAAPKAKAPAPKAKRRNAALQREAASRKAAADRRAALQQLMEDSLPLDEDVAFGPPRERSYSIGIPTQEELIRDVRRNPLVRGISALRGRGDIPAPGRNPTEAEFAAAPQKQPRFNNDIYALRRTLRSNREAAKNVDVAGAPYRGSGRGIAGPPVPPRAMPDSRRGSDFPLPPPERQLRRGVSRVPTGDFGVGSGLTDRAEDIRILPSPPPARIPTEAEFTARPGPGMGYDPNLDPTTGISIDDDVIQERFMRDTPRGSDAPLTDNEGRDYETLREYFIEDMSPRKSNVMTPFGIIEIDTTEEGMFPDQDMFLEKKGGRLKKKKRVARKKKAAPKKKKTVAKKKPVVRKKAIAKKPLVRKKAVAKKSAGRKRAAKRGFGAELRGN